MPTRDFTEQLPLVRAVNQQACFSLRRGFDAQGPGPSCRLRHREACSGLPSSGRKNVTHRLSRSVPNLIPLVFYSRALKQKSHLSLFGVWKCLVFSSSARPRIPGLFLVFYAACKWLRSSLRGSFSREVHSAHRQQPRATEGLGPKLLPWSDMGRLFSGPPSKSAEAGRRPKKTGRPPAPSR